MIKHRLLLQIFTIFLLFTFAFSVQPVQAHEQSLASTHFTFQNKKMTATMLLDQKSVLEIKGEDITKLNNISEDQLDTVAHDKMLAYIKQGFKVTNNGQLMDVAILDMSIPDLTNVQLDLEFSSTELIDQIRFDYNLYFENSNGKHKNVATIEHGEVTDEFIFADKSRTLDVQAGLQLPFWTAFSQFLILGFEHIVTGYDHIMFLLALILLGGRFLDVVKIVTSFTVAHSITLIAGSFDIIKLDGTLVDSLVALSILYVALENFWVKNMSKRWIITFAFGLMHGFAFAGNLAEIQVPQNHFVSSLLTFNLGVELGQLLIVALLLPLITLAKRFTWNKYMIRTVSVAIAIFGLNWFLLRATGFLLIPFFDI